MFPYWENCCRIKEAHDCGNPNTVTQVESSSSADWMLSLQGTNQLLFVERKARTLPTLASKTDRLVLVREHAICWRHERSSASDCLLDWTLWTNSRFNTVLLKYQRNIEFNGLYLASGCRVQWRDLPCAKRSCWVLTGQFATKTTRIHDLRKIH